MDCIPRKHSNTLVTWKPTTKDVIADDGNLCPHAVSSGTSKAAI